MDAAVTWSLCWSSPPAPRLALSEDGTRHGGQAASTAAAWPPSQLLEVLGAVLGGRRFARVRWPSGQNFVLVSCVNTHGIHLCRAPPGTGNEPWAFGCEPLKLQPLHLPY